MKPRSLLARSLAVLSLLGQPGANAAQNWPQPGLNSQHTGYNTKEHVLNASNVGTLQQKWSMPTGNVVNTPPILNSKEVYTLSTDGVLYAASAKTGAIDWTYQAYTSTIPGNVEGVVTGGGTVYTTCQIDADNGPDGGHFGLCALNAATGALLWTYAIYQEGGGVDSAPYTGPVLDGGLVLMGESDTASFAHVGYFVALNSTTGQQVWAIGNCANEANDCDGMSSATPAVDNGLVIYGTGVINTNGSNICARVESSGEGKWCTDLLTDPREAVTVTSGKVLFAENAADVQSAQLIALDEGTGKTLWHTTISGGSFPHIGPAVANSIAYFVEGGTNTQRDLFAVKVATGKMVWSYTGGAAPGSVTSGISVANGVVYAQCTLGPCAFDAQTGNLLLSNTKGHGSVGAPVVANGQVITPCNLNNVCLYKPKN